MHLHEFAVVHEAADHVEHIVRLAVVVGNDGGEPFGDFAVGARRRVCVGRRLFVGVGRQVGEHGARVVDRVGLVLTEVVRHAGGGVVHVAAAEVIHADHFAGGRLDHVGAGDEHVGVLAGHDDQVGQCRAVDGAARAGAEDQRQLRHETAGVAGLAEQVAVLGQCGDAFLDARAAGIDERDDRHFEVERLVHETADLASLGDAQRAAFDGEVLRVDGHLASEHLAEAGDDRRARAAAVDVAAAESSDFLERAGVEQQVEAFAGGQLAFDVLAFAGVVLGLVRELRRAEHGRANRLGRVVRRGFGGFSAFMPLLLHGDFHGLFDGRTGDDVGHRSPPSVLASSFFLASSCFEDAPSTSMVISVSPASTPVAGPTKIFVTVPLTGAYT